MRRYRLGSHAKYDLKVHLVWRPKYRKRMFRLSPFGVTIAEYPVTPSKLVALIAAAPG